MEEPLVMWASWAVVAAYGAWMAWKEIWPVASRLLRQGAAAGAFQPLRGAAAYLEDARVLRACGWLLIWVLVCTAWSALLVWSGRLIWSGSPLARTLFG
ncbi:MAG: hypothetical protein AB1609_06310 [Bacillota bacterium]